MVWGMLLPTNFGPFSPEGYLETDRWGVDGWGPRLISHYLSQSAQEQRRLFDHGDVPNGSGYRTFVIRKFVNEPGTGAGEEHPNFTPVEPHEQPKTFLSKPYPSLGSLIVLDYGILAVDEDLKAIIERLEPGVHGFFPIEIKTLSRRGEIEPLGRSFYTLLVGHYCSSFAPEQSDPASFNSYQGRHGFKDKGKGAAGMALSREGFGHSHLWRERGFTAGPLFFSDELMVGIDANGLQLPKRFRLREV